MDVRRVVSGVGRTFIAAGVLILLFVGYQLWGTNLAEARNQDALFDAFQSRLAARTAAAEEGGPSTTTAGSGPRGPGAPAATAPSPSSTSSTSTTTSTTAPPRPVPGDAVGIIRIPKIGVEKAVVEGVSVADLKKGPGHYPGTPMPGQAGNAAIAGHRTTYGAPFYRLDELKPGDTIEVQTHQGEFTYIVRESLIVAPSQSEVLDPTDDNRLTLTTCNPRFSARERLIVVAELAADAEPAPAPPPVTARVGGDLPGEDVASPEVAGLSGDPAANGPAIAWGGLAAAVWLVTWVLSRRWGKLAAYALGTPLFLVVLFVFFENVSRLLPANV